MDNFEIIQPYKSRNTVEYKDMLASEISYQEEVYKRAHEIACGRKKIVDVGCGSAEKLFKYFSDFDFIGVDVEETVRQLKDKYPNHCWITEIPNADLVILADVVEHVKNPNKMLQQLECLCIISTPIRQENNVGPPASKYHFREWTMVEFNNFVSRYFHILEHVKFYNIDHKSQYIICEPKCN